MSSAPEEDRQKALALVLSQIQARFGEGAMMRLGDEGFVPIEVIPTGAIALDAALGIGGFAGGRALKFYASVRLDVRRIETLKDGAEPVGNRTRVRVVKNKLAPPFKTAEFDILFGTGISREGSLIDLGMEQGIVRKSGAWYTCEGDQLGQGKENARHFLHDNPDLANGIEKKIKEKLGVGPKLDSETMAEL